MSSPLLFDPKGPIARLTLNRPELGNSIDLEMACALVDATIRCDRDPAIRCVVLQGAGRLFCAGGDVGSIAAAGDAAGRLIAELAGTLHGAISRLTRMPKPLLVLVQGPVAGAGLGLAALGDIVLAARSAHFTAAYTAVGLTPDGGTTWLLPRLIGLRRAQEMILTNRRVSAGEAAAIGLVTRVVEDEALGDEGDRVAGALAASATVALGASRRLLLDGAWRPFEDHLESEVRAIAAAVAGAEAREGMAAFLAKKPPMFEQLRERP